MKKTGLALAIMISVSLFIGCSDERLPEIQKGEFPFQIVYEFKNEMITIEDSVVCEFQELTPLYLVPGKFRTWKSSLKSGDERRIFTIYEEKNEESIFNDGRINQNARVYIHYGEPEYYMDDPQADHMSHPSPGIEYMEIYQESEKVTNYFSKTLSVSDAEKYFGIKIEQFEFSDPIKNSFR